MFVIKFKQDHLAAVAVEGYTPGSWPGVGGGNYSDAGVGEKCLDCAEDKRRFLEITSQRGP